MNEVPRYKKICSVSWLTEGTAFAVIGSIGFLIDGGLLVFLNFWIGLNVYGSRAISFPLATIATWYLNRKFTFKNVRAKAKSAREEYFRYLAVQIGGGIANLFIFVLCVHFFAWMKHFPVVPLAIGAIFGLIFNYVFSKTFVFGGH